jgi:hypothetical protein
MSAPGPRTPWSVPEPGCPGPDVRHGFDSDGDGAADSVFTADHDDLLLHTDLGGDGLGDRTLRLRPDGSAGLEPPPCPAAEPPTLLEALLRLLRGG